MSKGAGLFVIELYMNTPVVTLFGKNGMNYSDPGGIVDKGETSEQTAYREGREETANLINIQPAELLQYSIPVKMGGYTSYVIYVENLSYKDFMYNENLINYGCNQRAWKETNSMTRVELSKIILAADNLLNYATDVNGVNVSIRDRTMGLVKYGSNIILSLLNTKPIPLYRHQVTTSRMPCLIGTFTYTISPMAIYTPSTLPGHIEYAVYIAPDLTNASHPFLLNCAPTWGGMHITLAGYHTNQPAPQSFLQHISNSGIKPWTVSDNTIKVRKRTIYFKSKTLDSIGDFLHENKFYKVKGPKYSGKKWHVTSECKIPSDIKNILKHQTWSLVLVSNENGLITWLDKYPLNVI